MPQTLTLALAPPLTPLPPVPQDGERLEGERGLHSAEDIVYWTDGTYTAEEVLDMEARLLLHLDESGGVALCADAPVHYLCTY